MQCKSDPLPCEIDSDHPFRIMFMREFPIIDSATSVEQLKLRLKEGELEQYGAPFTPDFVYDVIKRLPRFSSMRVSNPKRLFLLNF